MEIDGKNTSVGSSAGIRRVDLDLPSTQRGQKQDEEPKKTGADRVELSVRSREIQDLAEMIRSVPDVREAKVEQVRLALEKGTYNVKAEKIADKILSGNAIDDIF